MAVLISENFDSYNNGDALLGLNGGSGWSGAYNSFTNSSVDNSQYKSSPNSVVLYNSFFRRPMSLSGFFTWSFYFYTTNTSGAMILGIDSDPLNPQEIYWSITSSGASARWVNGVALSNQSISSNTWNKYDMEIDASIGEFRARINNGTWSDWTAGSSPGSLSTSFNRIYCQSTSGAAGHIDSIEFTDTPLPIISNDLIQMIII